MNNSNTLGLNELGIESKMLRVTDTFISFSDDRITNGLIIV